MTPSIWYMTVTLIFVFCAAENPISRRAKLVMGFDPGPSTLLPRGPSVIMNVFSVNLYEHSYCIALAPIIGGARVFKLVRPII